MMSPRTLRRWHLLLSVAATPFLLLFTLSALIFAHHSLNFGQAQTTDRVYSFVASSDSSERPQEVAAWLRSEAGLRGAVGDVARGGADPNRLSFTMSRMGETHEIDVRQQGEAVRIQVTSQRQNAPGFMAALHSEVGIRDGTRAGTLWRVLVAGIGLVLIAIVITGGWLGWQRPSQRRLVLVVFSLSLTYCVVVISAVKLL